MPFTKSPAHRRYTQRVALCMTGYLLTLFLAVSAFRNHHVGGPVAWLLGLLPGLAVAGVFWALARLLVEEKDEYLRSLLVRQLLVASAFTMVIASIYGFLENFDLVAPIDAFYLTMLFFIGLGVGSIINRLAGRGSAC